MEIISSILVGHPVHILAIAGVFLAGRILLRMTRFGSGRNPRALLVVAAAWASYAAWEWLVAAFSPEANIRVDLMLIWPLLLIITIWFSIRAFR